MKKPRGMDETINRREFVNAAALGAAAAIGGLGVVKVGPARAAGKSAFTMIVVDFAKCTGCRTCETACAAYNHKKTVAGEELNGLGNPHLANIRVHGYNPDVDVPVVCAMCPDAPCVDICPVEPDQAGRKALYRDEKTGAIKADMDRCIGCTICAEECRTGAIVLNSEDKPERMCRLCDGDPQCVKHCPYDALSHVTVDTGMRFYGTKPDQIAEALIREWYE